MQRARTEVAANCWWRQLAERLCTPFMRGFLGFSRIRVILTLKLKQTRVKKKKKWETHWCLLVTISCFTSITSEKRTDRRGNKRDSLRLPRWEPVTPTTRAPTNKLGDNSTIKCLNGAAVGGSQRRKSSVWDVKTTPPFPDGLLLIHAPVLSVCPPPPNDYSPLLRSVFFFTSGATDGNQACDWLLALS